MRTIVVMLAALWIGACDGGDEPEVAMPPAPPRPAAVARIAAIAPPALPVEPPLLVPVVAETEVELADADEPADTDTDTDTEGIADVDDRCPDPPETINGSEDVDGCPEPEPAP